MTNGGKTAIENKKKKNGNGGIAKGNGKNV
jgi:hypothetical protein